MMDDHSMIISDGTMEHPGFIAMKPQEMEEVILGNNHVGQFIFHDNVGNEMIVEQNIEVGGEDDPHGEIILVPNNMIKQEDIIEGGEIVVGSTVGNEVIIGDPVGTQIDSERFVVGSAIEMGTDQVDDGTFDDSKLVIDTALHLIEEGGPAIAYDCGECGALLRSRASLKKHIKSQHTKQKSKSKDKKSKNKDMSNSSNKLYNCPSCSYSTQRRDKLDKHIQKHVLVDGFHPCGKRRHKPQDPPQRHRHNAEEYKCPHCPYSCTVYKALKKHQKLHISANKNFSLKVSCKICGKDRPTEADLRKHMNKHRSENNFMCDICGFASIQLKKIIQHRRMHTGEKPHLCPHCPYRSARRDNLRSHVRRMHKKENMYIDTFNPDEEIPD